MADKTDLIGKASNWLRGRRATGLEKTMGDIVENAMEGPSIEQASRFTKAKGLQKPGSVEKWLGKTNEAENFLMQEAMGGGALMGGVLGGASSIGQDDSFIGSVMEGALIGGIGAGAMQRRRSMGRRPGGRYGKNVQAADSRIIKNQEEIGALDTNRASSGGFWDNVGRKKTSQQKANRAVEKGLINDTKIQNKIIDTNTKNLSAGAEGVNYMGYGVAAGGLTLAHNLLNGNNALY